MQTLYYKITKEHKQYKGVRYFKYHAHAERVVQVCVNPGEEKKGRNATFGVYLIHRLTFLCNYLSIGYALRCTKAEYDKNFKQVVKMLK